MSKKCSVCGSDCKDNAKFCEGCGNAFAAQTGYNNSNAYTNQPNNFGGYQNYSQPNNQNGFNYGYNNYNNANPNGFRFAYGNPYGTNNFTKRTNKGLVVTICIIVALLMLTGIIAPIIIALNGVFLSSSEKSKYFSEGIAQAEKDGYSYTYYIAPGETYSLTDGDTISGMDFYVYDDSIVTADSKGNVTGVSKGTGYVLWYYSDDENSHGVLKFEVDEKYKGWYDSYSKYYSSYGSGQKVYNS